MVSGRFDELEWPGYHLDSHLDFPVTLMELDGPLMLAWCLHGDVVLNQWCGARNERRWPGTEIKMWVLYSGLLISSFVALVILIHPPSPSFAI